MTQVTECYDLRWTRGALSILCWLSMAASGHAPPDHPCTDSAVLRLGEALRSRLVDPLPEGR